MPLTQLDVTTQDGVSDCRMFRPDGAGPFPAVLFYQDGLGVRPALEAMGERLASHGYFVFMPNLFYRAGAYAPFDPAKVWTVPEERARLMAIIQPAGAGAMADTAQYLEAMAAQPGVRADQIGAVGYCLGGRLALAAAEAYPDRVAAAASIHAGGVVTDAPDSPHLGVGKVRGRLYFGVADEDAGFNAEHQAKLEAALKAAGTRYDLEVYRGAKHGFAVGDTPVYDAQAAEQHWERVLSLFKETLPTSRAG